MIIGDKVKLNITELENIGWEGLYAYDNTSNKDYVPYILENKEKIYKIKLLDNTCRDHPYKLDDEFLKETSFSKEELILVS
jgi:hypothetical protein